MFRNSNFFDTSAWFEMFTLENEKQSNAVKEIIKSARYQIVTSDFVIDELMTLLRCRKKVNAIGAAWELINNPANVTRRSLSREDVDETYRLFQKFSDKEWSFTDCSSYLLIRRHAIPFACAFNGHFREFGIVNVLP